VGPRLGVPRERDASVPHQEFSKVLMRQRGTRARDKHPGRYGIVPPYNHYASLRSSYKFTLYSLLNIALFVTHAEL